MKFRVSHNNDPGLLNIPLMGTDQYYRSNLSDGSVTDFVGNLVYEDNTLKRILIDGGYIENGTYYFFLTDHLGSIRVVADVSGSVVQRNHFCPFGLSFADNENPETQPYKFNGKELDLFHGLNWYDYLARGMDPAAGRFTAIDPLCEKYFALSPYVFCANNPVNYIDPDGMDWYEANNKEIIWTNYTNQKELDDNKIEGKYLGQAHVVFSGSRDERLGKKNGKNGYIDGEGAITANVTLYGPRGADDITTMTGFTMTSNVNKYGAIAEGLFNANYDVNGKSGILKSNWVLNHRKEIPTMDNKPNQSPYAGENYGKPIKTGIFIHSTNSSGYAGGTVSTGCLLLAPQDFQNFNKIMSGVRNFTVRLTREQTIIVPFPLAVFIGHEPFIRLTTIRR